MSSSCAVPVTVGAQRVGAGVNGFALGALLLLSVLLTGCAGVKVDAVSDEDYLTLRRGDVLTTGSLSASSRTVLQVVGMDAKRCMKDVPSCRQVLAANTGLGDEQRLAALAELWLMEAQGRQSTLSAEQRTDAYLESARHAYAYLFKTQRSPEQRALEDRQTQVRDYYNYAVQQALSELFARFSEVPAGAQDAQGVFNLRSPRWHISGYMDSMRLSEGRELPKELLPAPSLSFAGLRNQYRRDGLGAEMVGVTAKRVVNRKSEGRAWSETPFPAISAVARFPGETLEQVLAGKRVEIIGYDPYRRDQVELSGHQVPLAANFTSGYGLWLARSGFARQSLLTLVGRGEVLESPHLYLLQPYDPNRRIIIMLHGLASSPEAWINVANEVLGDETLRRNFQIWQVYYPTNLPIPMNNLAVRQTIEKTLAHFDPEGTAIASRDIVLVGHSMGGVLSRLMVSSSGEQAWESLKNRYKLRGARLTRARKSVRPYVEFEPVPQVSRAVFIAAPHRGTPFAEQRLARWAAGLVRFPVSVLGRFSEAAQVLVDPNSAAPQALVRPLSSIDNLSSRDPFVKMAANLPIAPGVHYHSIIGNYTPELALSESSDGVVPYASAHLANATSEKVLPSWHSVQEKPEAILEVRRILHEHLETLDGLAEHRP